MKGRPLLLSLVALLLVEANISNGTVPTDRVRGDTLISDESHDTSSQESRYISSRPIESGEDTQSIEEEQDQDSSNPDDYVVLRYIDAIFMLAGSIKDQEERPETPMVGPHCRASEAPLPLPRLGRIIPEAGEQYMLIELVNTLLGTAPHDHVASREEYLNLFVDLFKVATEWGINLPDTGKDGIIDCIRSVQGRGLFQHNNSENVWSFFDAFNSNYSLNHVFSPFRKIVKIYEGTYNNEDVDRDDGMCEPNVDDFIRECQAAKGAIQPMAKGLVQAFTAYMSPLSCDSQRRVRRAPETLDAVLGVILSATPEDREQLASLIRTLILAYVAGDQYFLNEGSSPFLLSAFEEAKMEATDFLEGKGGDILHEVGIRCFPEFYHMDEINEAGFLAHNMGKATCVAHTSFQLLLKSGPEILHKMRLLHALKGDDAAALEEGVGEIRITSVSQLSHFIREMVKQELDLDVNSGFERVMRGINRYPGRGPSSHPIRSHAWTGRGPLFYATA